MKTLTFVVLYLGFVGGVFLCGYKIGKIDASLNVLQQPGISASISLICNDLIDGELDLAVKQVEALQYFHRCEYGFGD